MVSVRKQERVWQRTNKQYRADYRLARALRTSIKKYSDRRPYEPFVKYGHHLSAETRPWRPGEVFITTRCRLSKSDTEKSRFFKARVWFGFWKSLLMACAPTQIVSFFFDSSSETPWGGVWDSHKFYYLAFLTIFISYFVYHQSKFVSGRQRLRDTFGFPHKSEEIRKSEQTLYETLSEDHVTFLAERDEQNRNIREKAAKRREEEKRKATSRQSLSHRVRMPKHADDFEEVCAEWMRAAGYKGAARTAKGPDGGADVVSNRAVAQAKMYSAQKVTAEEVRALVGTRQEYGKALALFFVYGLGYTENAVQVAWKTGVKLFALDVGTQKFWRITPTLDDEDPNDEDYSDESLEDDEFLEG